MSNVSTSSTASGCGDQAAAAEPVTPRAHPMDAQIVSMLCERLPGLRALYRYGSAGGIYARQDSDLDLALLAARPLTFDETVRLSADLSRLTGRDIDFHDLRVLPVTLRVQIVLDGVRLYAASAAAAEEYESRTLSDYVRLNEERRGILDDVRERGRIHG